MYECYLGYKCENGEVIRVVGHALSKAIAYRTAYLELKTYPYFYNHPFEESRLIK